MADSIKIMVRVRPFNERQLTNNFSNIIEMEGQEVRLKNPEAPNDPPRKFGFHRCYYSTDDSMGHPPINNQQVFTDIGKEILDQMYQGYNSTIFAYGQTGAGKSYSIEGKQPEKGLLQMCLESIFEQKEENSKSGLATSVKVTYLEIYNEKLRDLVNPVQRDIRVVQIGTSITINGVDPFPVNSYEDVLKVFEDGKKIRVVGGHAMNKNSSRSHAIFTIHYKQSGKGKMIDAKFNIVDLAGSERQSKTGATGKRLEEANKINASLTNLGIVIEKLAHNCQQKKSEYVPYRNSILTHILSESLSGNSKTFMIAAISPADDNYEQSLSTLRFAQRASLITTQSKKNVSAKEGYNKQLLLEIERLKKELEAAKTGGGSHSHSVSVEYITVEKEAASMDGKIADMVSALDQNIVQKTILQKKLEQLEAERKKLEQEKEQNGTLSPENDERLKQLELEIAKLKEQLQNMSKTREQLENELSSERKKREQLDDELKKAKGQISEEQTRAAELNARIMMMMLEFESNKTDKESLLKELEEERRMKAEIEENRKKLLAEAGLSSQSTDINERKFPYIMNVSEDPTLLGMLLYDLKDGETKIGTKQGEENHIKLNVLGIMPRHCSMFNDKGSISIQPNPEAKVFVNGVLITKKKDLNHLDRVTMGHANNFKLIIPGKGTADDLRQSMALTGQYGEYIDDKLAAKTIEAKSMKQFLIQMQQRMDKHLFAKFIQKFKNLLQDVDQMNEYTFHRYKKFPLKSKNVCFRLNVLVDIENYMKGVPQVVVICEHKESKDILFVWSEQKFQKRLDDMESWYEGAGTQQGDNSYYEFDPWFEADDDFVQEKAKLENMKTRQLLQLWNKKQQENAQNYKKILQQQKMILAELKSLGYSENLVEDYGDFYFRSFPCADNIKEQLEGMRKKEDVHKRIQRFMECCAEVQKCNMDNKFFNLQKDKYKGAKDLGKTRESAVSSTPLVSGGGAADEGLLQENIWLNTKVEELQQELKKRTQMINKLRKGT